MRFAAAAAVLAAARLGHRDHHASLADARPPLPDLTGLAKFAQNATQLKFSIQWVKTQPKGDPMSPLDPNGSKCWKIGGDDKLPGGRVLTTTRCHHTDPETKGKPPDPLALWSFTKDGLIRNPETGLCVRRMWCTEFAVQVVDAGPCTAGKSMNFVVHKGLAGNIKNMQPVGPPLAAVISPGERLFGPFRLQLNRKPSTVSCDRHGKCHEVEPSVGWRPEYDHGMTKQPATVPGVGGKPYVHDSLVTDSDPRSLADYSGAEKYMVDSPLPGVMCGTDFEVSTIGGTDFAYFVRVD